VQHPLSPYFADTARLTARAAQAEETRGRIGDAAVALNSITEAINILLNAHGSGGLVNLFEVQWE
jgi:hypothetical protein